MAVQAVLSKTESPPQVADFNITGNGTVGGSFDVANQVSVAGAANIGDTLTVSVPAATYNLILNRSDQSNAKIQFGDNNGTLSIDNDSGTNILSLTQTGYLTLASGISASADISTTTNIYADGNISASGEIGSGYTTRITGAGDLVNIGHITASEDITAKALNAFGYLTSNTSASDAGKWTKLASCTLTAQYTDCRTTALISLFADGDGTTGRATVNWRVKQQDPLGSPASVGLDISDSSAINADDFTSVTTVNDGTSTVAELWGKLDFGYQDWSISPLNNTSTPVTWLENQGFSTTLPAGAQTVGTYSDGIFDTVSSTYGFSVNSNTGVTTACSSGTFLQNQEVIGGIVTGGTCAAAGTGSASTLQDAYDASGATNPQIQLSNTNGGIKIRDATSSTIGNLFQIQNSGGTVTYFGVTASGLSMQNTSATSALDFSNSTGHLKIYNPSSVSNYADIYYDNTNGEAVYAASSGNTTRVGNGSGNIQLVLTNAADVLTGTKTVTLGSAYGANDFSFTRTISAGANALTGNVVKIESTSTGTGTLSSNILLLNENNSSATGNLLVAQKSGVNKFSVDTNGNTVAGGTLMATGLLSGAAGVSIAAGQSYTGLGAVNINSAAATNLTLSAGTTGQVIAKAATNSTASFEIQNSSAGSLLTADSTNSRIYIGEPVADANATLLVLDNYTTAGDPTGVNGSMYYNTSTSRFRCQKNGTWEDCLTGRVAKKTANQSNSTTTFADVSDLTFSVAANVDYLLTCTISYQTAATTTGIRLSVNGPTSPTLVSGINQANASASTAVNNYVINGYDNGGVSAGVSAANTNMVAQVQVIFRNGNNAGTLALRMASEVAGSNAQINAGSYCRLEQD